MGQQWDQGRSQKVSGNKWKWTHNNSKFMDGTEQRQSERKVHNDTGLPKKDGNISNKQPNPMPTRTGGTTKKDNPEQVQGRK